MNELAAKVQQQHLPPTWRQFILFCFRHIMSSSTHAKERPFFFAGGWRKWFSYICLLGEGKHNREADQKVCLLLMISLSLIIKKRMEWKEKGSCSPKDLLMKKPSRRRRPERIFFLTDLLGGPLSKKWKKVTCRWWPRYNSSPPLWSFFCGYIWVLYLLKWLNLDNPIHFFYYFICLYCGFPLLGLIET